MLQNRVAAAGLLVGMLFVSPYDAMACPIVGDCVQPVGSPSHPPTFSLPNSNGYKITSRHFTAPDEEHAGVDLANGRSGGEIRSIANGIVVDRIDSNDDDDFGHLIRIEHSLVGGGRVYSIYAHMKAWSVVVSVGDSVSKGQRIGEVNATGFVIASADSDGDHLHFAIRKINDNGCGRVPSRIPQCESDTPENYFDPLPFLEFQPRSNTIALEAVDDRNINDLDGDLVADALGPQNDGFLRVFGVSGPSAAFRAALEFNVAVIPAGSIVNSATLSLHDRGSTFNPPFTISLHGYIGDGTVSIADGNAITPFNFVGSYTNNSNTGNPDYAIDVKSFLQFYVDHNQPFAGILLRSSGEGGLFRGNDLASRDHADSAARPRLVVTYSPPR